MKIQRDSLQYFLMLLLLSAIWGGAFLFMRVAGPDFGPIFLIALRVWISAVLLVAVAHFAGGLPDFRKNWKAFLLLGAINNAIPFTLIASAVLVLNSSMAAIINATTPLFTAIVAAAFGLERFTARKGLGGLLGILGVVILMGFSPLPLNQRTILAALESLLAAVAYAFGAVYVRARFQGFTPLQVSAGQLAGAGAAMLPAAFFFLPKGSPSALAWLSLLALAVLCTCLAYLIYFRLITKGGATKAITVTFMVPFFSLLWGVLLLSEPLNWGMFAGLAVILFSVSLVLGSRS